MKRISSLLALAACVVSTASMAGAPVGPVPLRASSCAGFPSVLVMVGVFGPRDTLGSRMSDRRALRDPTTGAHTDAPGRSQRQPAARRGGGWRAARNLQRRHPRQERIGVDRLVVPGR